MICRACHKDKDPSKFDPGRRQCRMCRDSAKRRGPQERRRRLKYFYNLTPEQYDEMYAAQNGSCKLCGGPDNGPWKRLAVDHCHKTGRVRGLLCSKCNKGLGQFNDDPVLFQKAISYLKDNST